MDVQVRGMNPPPDDVTTSEYPTDGLAARTAVSMALSSSCDLDKPVLIKLGLNDDRLLPVRAWSIKNGHLTLVLDENHDHFPVAHYVLGAPGRSALRTASEHKARGMFATTQEKNGG